VALIASPRAGLYQLLRLPLEPAEGAQAAAGQQGAQHFKDPPPVTDYSGLLELYMASELFSDKFLLAPAELRSWPAYCDREGMMDLVLDLLGPASFLNEVRAAGRLPQPAGRRLAPAALGPIMQCMEVRAAAANSEPGAESVLLTGLPCDTQACCIATRDHKWVNTLVEVPPQTLALLEAVGAVNGGGSMRWDG
jgi:hypothetical protein